MITWLIGGVSGIVALIFFAMSALAFDVKIYNEKPSMGKMQTNRFTFFFTGIAFVLLGILIII